jgi:hypothetical protein
MHGELRYVALDALRMGAKEILLMRLRLVAGLLACSAVSGPLPAQPSDEPSLQFYVRTYGNDVAAEPSGTVDGFPADKLVVLKQGPYEPTVMGTAVAPAGSVVTLQLDENAIALLRTRTSNSHDFNRPDEADIALAQAVDVPVFIVGEWNSPPLIWEVRLTGRRLAWRHVDRFGLVGPWQDMQLPEEDEAGES